MITFVIPKVREVWSSWKQTLYIGLPNAAANMLVPLSAAIVTRLVAGYGPAAVAGFGVATRIETFGLLVVMALVVVLSPFVGQNWGAKKYDRAEQGVKYSERFSLGWGLALVVLLAIIGRPLAAVFNDDPVVVSTAATYFLIVPISYGLNGVMRISSTVISVLNKPLRSALLALAQTFALYVPLAFLGSELFGLPGIFAAASLSFIIAGIVGYFWLKRTLTDSMDYDYLQRIVQVQELGDRPASLGYWIAQLQGQALNYFEQSLSKYQLDRRTLMFLVDLLREDGQTQSQLSEQLLVNETATKRSISKLVDLGYVKRESDPRDGEGEMILITPRGQEISPEVRSVMQSWSSRLSQGFTEKERKTVLDLLTKMEANVASSQS